MNCVEKKTSSLLRRARYLEIRFRKHNVRSKQNTAVVGKLQNYALESYIFLQSILRVKGREGEEVK